MPDTVAIRPASTVVLLRDGQEGLETLLLKRNKALAFAGGFWVFPGGSLDPEDMAAGEGNEEAAARFAAAREAMEECGQQPRPDDMVLLSHWTTPEAETRRFSTWIYAAPLHLEPRGSALPNPLDTSSAPSRSAPKEMMTAPWTMRVIRLIPKILLPCHRLLSQRGARCLIH